jgi:ElaB/YqjD/DUF883 family membrane-anchored ribosome-binding protein
MEAKQSSSSSEQHPTRTANGRGSDKHELRDAWDEVVTSTTELYRAADTFATEQVQVRPHTVLGVAAGLGFVLGGGLASRVGSTLLTVGARLVASRFLEDWTAPPE